MTKMNDSEFWALINRSWETHPRNWDAHRTEIESALADAAETDLIDYTKTFARYKTKAFTPEVLCGAYLLYEGWLSPDSFLDFTDCLVAASSEIYKKVLSDPDEQGGYDRIEIDGKTGFDILNPNLAKKLAPKLFKEYSAAAWA